jgi:starch-binding outer membrane protein, SusD/RagB family
MKRIKILSIGFVMAAIFIGNSCTKDLLVEQPQSLIVPSFFSSATGLQGGIAGVYNDMRGYWGTEGFTINQMAGTDDHLAGGSAGNPRLYTYNGIQAADFSGGFNLYTDINTLNGVLEIGPTATGIDTATLSHFIGQATFLRAFLYFYLVQTYGNIPLHTKFITVPSQADAPAPASDIYALIISDLGTAVSKLPPTPQTPFLGKAATRAAAKWLLAKVYLTRGWLTGSAQDFQSALAVANDLITNKTTYGLDLWQNYADAFAPANDYGKETIFVSDHSNDAKYGEYQLGASGGAGVNVTPWMGLWNGPSVLGINSVPGSNGLIGNTGPQMLFRDVQYGRPFTRIRPNIPKVATGPNAGKSYIYDQAFAERVYDSRYSKTFQTLWLANLAATGGAAYSGNGTAGTRGTLTCGKDTAVWFPDYEVTGAPQAFGARPFKGIIVTPSMVSNTVYPYMKKLADPSRVSPNDPSTRPVVIARFAEMYLIAAEAAFKLGDNTTAMNMINVLRQRAAFRTNTTTVTTTTITADLYPAGKTITDALAVVTLTDPSVITLDFILDERTREFYGESERWPDLVRTQSLGTRLAAWNPTEASFFQSFNTLRPIPLDEINYVTVGPKYPQNPGY